MGYNNNNKNNKATETTIINVLVRIHKDIVQLSIDTSTTPLHKRGYRLEGAKAPLREDLAFALVYPYCHNNNNNNNNNNDSSLSSKRITRVIDPFC